MVDVSSFLECTERDLDFKTREEEKIIYRYSKMALLSALSQREGFF
jgi:hypothetical protein